MKGFRYSSEAFLEEKMGNKLNKKAYPLYLLVPAVVVYSVFIIIPFLFSIFFSLTDWNIRKNVHAGIPWCDKLFDSIAG